MIDVRLLLAHWGYAALFLGIVLGNVGIPVPETCVLWVAGFLVWQHRFSLPAVLGLGIVAAVVGDNCGYWLGRRYGQTVVARYGQWIGLTPARIVKTRGFLVRYGPAGVFGARFVTGLRFLAGPLAGSVGLSPGTFFLANVLGALVYVPLTVGEGYAVGYGLGDYVARIHHGIVSLEQVLLVGALLGLCLLLGWRLRSRWHARNRFTQGVSRLDGVEP
jgi:membrane protein DedA with SNARE-associated domain